MASISISVYAIGLKNRKNDVPYNLNDIDGITFLQHLTGFLNLNVGDFQRTEILSKVFKVENYQQFDHHFRGVEDYKYIIGKVKSGSYGLTSEIIDSATGATQYNKNESDADVIPFYFTLAVPAGETNRGILILENVGVFGIKQQFDRLLEEYLRSINPEYELSINSFTPVQYIDHFLDDGVIKSMRFIRYDIPADTAQRLGLNNGVAFDEYVIHHVGRNNDIRDKIKSYVRGRVRIRNIAEIDFDYDNVKVEVKIGKRSKVLNLENINKIVISEDVTDRLVLLGGHPTEESMSVVFEENLEEYLTLSGLIVRD
ncbi:ribosome-associated translation inhibitor RaiA [Anaerosolibacter carboniphilus]|uniref:Ribosome-associated translation inhibitor RaiA n=1 Tax=Anaerosolibacter carboniphilus TaxID=1417629 RepID=A0A841KYH0_9FIRM|nr:hypothetical protein [Anaerosolibacter carboniphilus]MBB6218674.1 ribosome-associated translation inhibitor RaiA [Anaerosolibacter carboniphilus]